ncbi:hypothetical protein BDN70DRAFT_452684 [Pholiota conissans]|uniref:Uncharacterized protein n=1 Tax=Pholiota conissans TaxID=109636 RepID=A0A9P6CWU5_9AGAR|nr:hypothetical protein BDN70DRAFT_452684 [Pholiota conissans]
MAPFSAQLAKSFLRASTCRRTSLQHSLAGLGTPARRWNTTSAPTATAEPAMESEPPVKKKRGRKPKAENLQEDPTEEPESVAPKKRGRKPKVEKVYEDPSTKPVRR